MKLALVHLADIEAEPPLGLAYITSYLRKNGFDDTVIIEREDIMKRLRKEKPDLIGISSMTFKFPEANSLAGKIKEEFDVPVINGGCHITAMSHHLAKSNFDIGVIGEGEQTMLELVELFEKEGFNNKNLESVKGIVFGNKTTGKRELIEPLDSIPFPARDLLKMKNVYLLLKRSAFSQPGIYTTMLTSRGCPYNCVFCYPKGFWRKIRLNSAEYVVEEMKMLKEKYKLDGIAIRDDLFVVSKQRVEKIAELLKKEDLDLRFSILARANLITEDLVKTLKSMNVTTIGFGLESGSERILNYLKKGTVTVEQNYNALKLCKKYGIFTVATFIIGSPRETEEDLKMTMKLVTNENLDEAGVYQLTPLPATEIWDYAKQASLVSDDINFPYAKLAIAGFRPDMLLNQELSMNQWKEWYNKFQQTINEKNFKMKKIGLKHLKYLLNPNFLKRLFFNWKIYSRYAKNILKQNLSS